MQETKASSSLSGPGVWVAVLVLLGFAGLVVTMILSANVTEQTWIRLAWVFSSVEAIAFAAAGAIFGSSVHRERAEKAEERAVKNEQQAANGRALATQLLVDGTQAPLPTAGAGERPDPLTGSGPPAGTAAGPSVDATAARHARAAQALFPDLA
jgi:hypothetical protein